MSAISAGVIATLSDGSGRRRGRKGGLEDAGKAVRRVRAVHLELFFCPVVLSWTAAVEGVVVKVSFGAAFFVTETARTFGASARVGGGARRCCLPCQNHINVGHAWQQRFLAQSMACGYGAYSFIPLRHVSAGVARRVRRQIGTLPRFKQTEDEEDEEEDDDDKDEETSRQERRRLPQGMFPLDKFLRGSALPCHLKPTLAWLL